MSRAIHDDPVEHGATDPAVVRDGSGRWWMFTTQRRTSDPADSVRWVHGTAIAVAMSDDGEHRTHRGTAALPPHERDTLWAPEVVRADDDWRMFVTVVPGIREDWTGGAHIEQYASPDLQHWRRIGEVPFPSERVIDAAVARTADGRWRMWVKNERDGSSTWSAVSDDLEQWDVEGVAVPADPAHEGPNVFRLGGWYWMVTDEWRGLGVHRSRDGIAWQRQQARGGLVLDEPGSDPTDRHVAHHADVLVAEDGRAALAFYFTHPHGEPYPHPWGAPNDGPLRRRSAIHVAALRVEQDVLVADRDAPLEQAFAPFRKGAAARAD